MKYQKRAVAYVLAILIVFGITAGGFAEVQGGTQTRNIKVAFFPMEGYHIVMSDGSYSGMDVEYLQALSKYTYFNIEYVPCDSWGEALQMLEDKKVDLVGSAQYSKERAEKFLYADLPSGYTFGAIAVKGDSTIAYEDFEAMSDITIGIVGTYIRKTEFFEYMADHGVKKPQVVEFDNTEKLQAALDNGQVDAIVHTFTEILEGQRIVGRFSPQPFYYMTYQGNEEMMRQLNQSIADLKMNHPELEANLMYEFYQKKLDQSVVFSTLEKTYLSEKKTLQVGYLDGFYPFSYEKNGNFTGLCKELLDEVSCITGLQMQYQKLSSVQDAQEALENKQIDILCYSALTEEEIAQKDLKRTSDYTTIPTVLVTDKDRKTDSLEKVAIVEDLMSEAMDSLKVDVTELEIYNTQQDCLYAVGAGEVDAALCDGYLAEYLLGSQTSYQTLEIKSVLNIDHKIGMVLPAGNDRILFNIIEKVVMPISDKRISEYIIQDNAFTPMSIRQFVEAHSATIIMGLIVVIVLVIGVAVHMIYNSIKIQKLMYKDFELDVWNLNYLTYQAAHSMLGSNKNHYALVAMNVAQFRLFNTLYGWKAGQTLLESIVNELSQEVIAPKEIFARDKGDHFILLLAFESEDALRGRLERLQKQLLERIYRNTDNRMAIKMGVYYIPKDNKDMRTAVSNANQAMEAIREKGDCFIQVYDKELETRLKEEHVKEKLLKSVDIQKEFVTYYQAKVDIRTEEIVGAEALVRFLDPTANGAVRSPFFFVPYYEKTGRITEVDFFVMECVCKMLRRRMDSGKKVVVVSCNFSRHHFIKPGFSERFEGILEKYQIPKEMIEVEITETLVVEELQQKIIQKTIQELKEKGIRLSIDDFGSGYSSLGVFEQIPASVIKLDRSFLLNQEDRNRQVAIMRGIVQMAENLDAQIVCEGVETNNDVELMKEIGVYVAQGYRYSKPIPEAEFEERLDRGINR